MIWIERAGERRRGICEPPARRAAGRYRVTDSTARAPAEIGARTAIGLRRTVPSLLWTLMRVFNPPVPVNGCHHLVEPANIGKLLCQHVTRIMFNAITLRTAQRLNQARPRQWGYDMRGNAQRLGNFLLGHRGAIFFQWLDF